MKKSDHRPSAANTSRDAEVILENNGHGNAMASVAPADLAVIQASLQAMHDGNFSVRLPVAWTGLAGKIADTFNEIAAVNEQMSQELKRIGQAVGKEGRTRERIRFHQSRGAWGAQGIWQGATDPKCQSRDSCGGRIPIKSLAAYDQPVQTAII